MAEKKFLDSTGVSALLAKVKTAINDAKAAASAPTATATSLGIVKPGNGLSVDTQGALSVDTTKFATVDAVNTAVTSKVDEVVGAAPGTYDTLTKVAEYIEEHKSVADALNTAIGTKANSADVYSKDDADSTFVKDALTAAEVEALCDTALA